jgi:pyruvate dehydrogenase E1 component alpha subunit
MLLIRRFEEKAGQLYGMGFIGGFCHLYIGQEAVVVGMQMALKDGDQVITGYRDHGHMLATGMEARGVMAELTGRQGGYSRGKGGSMHMFSKEKNFYGGHGIVGAQVSLGAGLAFANKYRGNDNVAVTYFGDGAANQGQVYESLQHGRSGSCRSSTSSRTTATPWARRRASLVGPVELLAARQLLRHPWRPGRRHGCACGSRRSRKSRRPLPRPARGRYILEMLTYRYRGHSMSDPAKYRTKDEVQKMREKHDPIEQVKARLLELKHASEDDLKAIDKEGARSWWQTR